MTEELERCPTCNSPRPQLHPANGGLCAHEFHKRPPIEIPVFPEDVSRLGFGTYAFEGGEYAEAVMLPRCPTCNSPAFHMHPCSWDEAGLVAGWATIGGTGAVKCADPFHDDAAAQAFTARLHHNDVAGSVYLRIPTNDPRLMTIFRALAQIPPHEIDRIARDTDSDEAELGLYYGSLDDHHSRWAATVGTLRQLGIVAQQVRDLLGFGKPLPAGIEVEKQNR